ncbi:MAG: FAD:protein FMN transferase [Verrucomicrobiota bacterium]
MRRRRFFLLALGAAGLAAVGQRTLRKGLHRLERKSLALGAPVTLTAYHLDPAAGEAALSAAFEALEAIEEVLSLYRPGSEICQLNRDGFLDQPHPDLVKVLGSALDWSRLTGGAFDPTVQPLWPLYACRRQPEAAELESACRLIDWRSIRLDDHRIQLNPGQSITLNGIAQGFAADRVCDVLRARGVEHALIDTGEFGSLGDKPGGEHWKVGIQHPRKREACIAWAALDGRFLATSGDYETAFNDDFSSHHIFDPATGRSPGLLSSVTVLAPSGLEADALSTAIFVLGPSRGLDLAASRRGVDCLVVRTNGQIIATAGFPGKA